MSSESGLPKAAKNVKLVGETSRRVGCFKDTNMQQAFINHLIESTTDKDFVKFFSKIADSVGEVDIFKENLKKCSFNIS